MIVAHVVRQYLPSVGGLEEVVRNLVKHQLNAGLIPYVITLNRVFNHQASTLPAIDWIDGVKVIRIPYIGSNRYPIALQVLKHIDTADLVHVHAIDFFYDFLAFTKIIHGKKLVVSTHGGFFHTSYASKLKRIYFKTITKLSGMFYDRVIGCSDNDGAIFEEIIHPDKLTVIENGVDVEKLATSRSALGPKPAIIYFGRWSVNKGIPEALHLFSELVKRDAHNSWTFAIAGRPYDLDEQAIYKIASDYGVRDRVLLHVNPTDSKLRELTEASSYFLCLSKHEGFGIAPIEAMSAGLYPLLSEIPPFKKLVTITGHGLMIESDVAQGAGAINDLHEKKTWNQSDLIKSVQRYSWNTVGDLYLTEYRRVLNHD